MASHQTNALWSLETIGIIILGISTASDMQGSIRGKCCGFRLEHLVTVSCLSTWSLFFDVHLSVIQTETRKLWRTFAIPPLMVR